MRYLVIALAAAASSVIARDDGDAAPFKVHLTIEGSGTVVSDPEGLRCAQPGDCGTHEFRGGADVKLIAPPGAGLSAQQWVVGAGDAGVNAGDAPSLTLEPSSSGHAEVLVVFGRAGGIGSGRDGGAGEAGIVDATGAGDGSHTTALTWTGFSPTSAQTGAPIFGIKPWSSWTRRHCDSRCKRSSARSPSTSTPTGKPRSGPASSRCLWAAAAGNLPVRCSRACTVVRSIEHGRRPGGIPREAAKSAEGAHVSIRHT